MIVPNIRQEGNGHTNGKSGVCSGLPMKSKKFAHVTFALPTKPNRLAEVVPDEL